MKKKLPEKKLPEKQAETATLTVVQSSYRVIRLNNRMIYVDSDPTNCKLSYIHNAGTLSYLSDEDKKQIIDFALKHCKGAVILNTTAKAVFDFIVKNYPTYYAENVPIGYNNGYQYHICFKNTVSVSNWCRKPAVIKKDSSGKLNITRIRTNLELILKSKRRKNDYVDEFINSLK
jgi:hypothetical protein